MKKILLMTAIAVAAGLGAMAQAPGIEWQKSLGGSGTEGDYLRSIQQTADGGYIVAGRSNSNDGDVTGNHGYDSYNEDLAEYFWIGSIDYWIVKLDNAGTIEWEKSLGGFSFDYVGLIQQTTDGGYIVAGESDSDDGDVTGNHGVFDYWIVKLDASGAIEWEKSLGGSGYDGVRSIQQTTDGGYIVAGQSNSDDGDITDYHGGSDYWIVKLDASGSIEWEKSLGGTSDDGFMSSISIQQTIGGGYIVAGFSESDDGDVTSHHGGIDYWIVKLDASGSIEWEKSLGGTGDESSFSPIFIQQTIGGGYIVAGSSDSNDGDVTGNHGEFDYWIVKLDASGSIEWEKSLGGAGYEFVTSIQQTADGGYIVAGESDSDDGDVSGHHGSNEYRDCWIVKLNNAGAIEWEKSLGGTSDDGISSIQQSIDGGYIVAGNSYSDDGDVSGHHGSNEYRDYWIVKLDASGTMEWEKSLGGSDDDVANFILQIADGGYIVAGSSESYDGDVTDYPFGADIWIVKLGITTGIHDMEHDASALFSLYPNPNKGIFTLEGTAEPGNYTVMISNVLGQEVYVQTAKASGNKLHIEIAAGDVTPGIYFLNVVKEGKRVAVKQFVIK